MLASWKKSYDQPTQHIKKQRHYFAKKSLSSPSYGFFSSYVWMWELGYKESWALKYWCFWTVMLSSLKRRLLRVPWTAGRSNQSILKEISPKYPVEGLMAEAETPILWPPDEKNWLIWKDPNAGEDWRQEEKGMTKDEIVEWHNRFDGHEFE